MLSFVRNLGFFLATLLLSSPVLAEWKVAETKQFRIYSDGSEKALIAYTRQLERFDWLLRTMTGASPDRVMPPLDIYMVRSQGKLRTLADLPRDTGGVYRATPTGTAAFSVRVNDVDDTALDILMHEYGHHFMMFHFPYVYPSWYVEGFAEYFSTADVKTDAMTIGRASRNRAEWLVYGDWIEAQALLTADAWSMKRNDSAMFYAQSWLATHYLLRDPERSQRLSAYLKRLSRGEALAPAFEAAFGMDMKTFGRQLSLYMKGRDFSYTRLTPKAGQVPEPFVTVRALPAAAETLLLPYAALKSGASEDAVGETLLAGLRREAGRYPDDPWAAELIAGVEAEFGDPSRGRALLDPLLKARPDDAELNYLVGRSHMRSAEDGDEAAHHAAARRHFARAYKARPHHYQTLYNYVRAQPDPRRKDVLNVLEETRALAPQVSEINVVLATVLIEVGAFRRAEIILSAMMMDPHSPPSEHVVELLQRARAGKSAPETASGAASQ